jgi:hypothetical protein
MAENPAAASGGRSMDRGKSSMTPMREKMRSRQVLLLFYKEHESDKYFKYDRYLKRVVRPLYEMLHHRQKKTGFRVSFELMRRALERSGWTVRINDYALARKHPEYPVGLVGFPVLLEGWDLPNPALLGPSLFDHPLLAPDLMKDPRFKAHLVLAQWTYDMFVPVYGSACARWYAGIDTSEWPDTSMCEKDIDFLIYDKIRWNHNELERGLLEPIQKELVKRGFRTRVVRYKLHDHASYADLLARSRAMVFLCEHETQGIAYQEALASNVPILAWDNGYWLDPLWKKVSDARIAASSVPFFSDECGETFRDLSEFEGALSRFLERWPVYTPRDYVIKNLSMEESAQQYVAHYFAPGRGPVS